MSFTTGSLLIMALLALWGAIRAKRLFNTTFEGGQGFNLDNDDDLATVEAHLANRSKRE